MRQANIVVLAGQSNAVGVAYTRFLPLHFSDDKVQEYINGYKNVPIFYYSHDKKSNGFVPTATGCAELKKDTFGPEVGIAEYFCAAHPKEQLFIIKCAVGGTNLWFDWCSPACGDPYDPQAGTMYKDGIWQSRKPKGAGWLYNQFVETLTEGIARLKAKGYTPNICGFCWMQGESDANAEHYADYATLYTRFMQDVQTTFGEYMQNCIFADAYISDRWPYYKEVNLGKQIYANTHKNCRFVDTIADGLTTLNEPPEAPDTVHYDSDSIIRLGHLFAEAIEL